MSRSTALGANRLLVSTVLVVLVACSGYSAFREAQIAERHGDWDAAVVHYLELVDQYPSNISYKAGLLRAKIQASREHFERAKELHDIGALEQAQRQFRMAVELDPTNQYAAAEMAKVARELEAAQGYDREPGSLAELKRQAREARPQPPLLNPRASSPISLSFPKKVSVLDIYKALGKSFGLNIQFAPKLRDQQISVELVDVTAQEALEIVMRTVGHFYKPINEDTILIIEDSPQNRRRYEDQVIQTFFLSNAEPKEMLTLLRSLVGAKNIASNEQLNAIVLRDTADKVKVAERLITTNDKARGEVVVHVELLQINTGKMRELGISLSDYTVVQELDQDPPLRVSDLEFIDQGDWILTLPSIIYDFVKANTEAQLLASPQVRISDGETANLVIGEQVPIPVTTFNTAQTVGSNIVPITSFQYQDIGILLEIEPRLHHNKEITLDVNIEVSNINGFVEGSGGTQQPIIGTRNIQSTIRLQDGETNFLAGLIRDDLTEGDVGLPGLSSIPVIGRLFSKKSTSKQRTDLVLTLTPHIIRTPDVTEEDLLPLWVGTDTNITFRGGSPRVESDVEGPFDDDDIPDDSGEDERIREMIRRRIQSLPRGSQTEGDPQEAEEPGVELVPAGLPDDPFVEEDDDNGDDGGVEQIAWHGDRWMPVPAVARSIGRPRFASEGDDVEPSIELALVPTSTGGVGEDVLVDVRVRAAVPISHAPLLVRYNPGRLELLSVEAGDFLGGEEEVRTLSNADRPGHLVLGVSRLGELPGVTGEGTVLRLRFRALEEGPTRVRFGRSRVLREDLEPVTPLRKSGATIHVGGEGQLSVPTDPIPDERPEREEPPLALR